MTMNDLPSVNASLNALSAVLVVAGYTAIRSRKIALHKTLMLSAVASSTIFLACYLTYHYYRTRVTGLGPTRFAGEGLSRPIYFMILTSHTILAVATVPLVIITVIRGLRSNFQKHKRIARWTLPIWLYVSVTGVIVYFMLYHWFAKPA